MGSRNEAAFLEGYLEYRKAWFENAEAELITACKQILKDAVSQRLAAPNAHDFTGNLLNSIAVILLSYINGKNTRRAFYSTDDGRVVSPHYETKWGVHGQRKMNRSNLAWTFKKDYSGAESGYKPEISTDNKIGVQNAIDFVSSVPITLANRKKPFVIIVAYATEYAEYIENIRQTTGAYAAQDLAGLQLIDLGAIVK